jgi:hypothetical protein
MSTQATQTTPVKHALRRDAIGVAAIVFFVVASSKSGGNALCSTDQHSGSHNT